MFEKLAWKKQDGSVTIYKASNTLNIHGQPKQIDYSLHERIKYKPNDPGFTLCITGHKPEQYTIRTRNDVKRHIESYKRRYA